MRLGSSTDRLVCSNPTMEVHEAAHMPSGLSLYSVIQNTDTVDFTNKIIPCMSTLLGHLAQVNYSRCQETSEMLIRSI